MYMHVDIPEMYFAKRLRTPERVLSAAETKPCKRKDNFYLKPWSILKDIGNQFHLVYSLNVYSFN